MTDDGRAELAKTSSTLPEKQNAVAAGGTEAGEEGDCGFLLDHSHDAGIELAMMLTLQLVNARSQKTYW
ncbi:hypothetical protein F2P81_019342 [Scophthalmus maximus]|uniref:Uncharacterized protein n=1 Tax=Scophthalmus maximus TaxID=52904 RepID=A0A6A4S7J2_SCOMX|nr:hypothetical protein F2P81_019342 [Scophthalmus maximus]